MGNKEWDNYLREILGELKTESEVPLGDDLAEQPDPANEHPDLSDSLQDEAFRKNISNNTRDERITGWERIEASLDAADREFDEEVRRKINQFHPAEDPHSWSVFLAKFSERKLLRSKIIALKVFETAAMLLLLITLLHLGQRGKLPFFIPSVKDAQSAVSQDLAAHSTNLSLQPTAEALPAAINKPSGLHATSEQLQTQPASHLHPSANSSTEIESQHHQPTSDATIPADESSFSFPAITDFELDEINPSFTEVKEITEPISARSSNQALISKSPTLPVCGPVTNNVHTVPDPIFVRTLEKSYMEFGMLVQADYNQLKMPEDRVNSDGKQIVFPLQGITSPGYGAGFTLAFGHTLWAIETGLIYSSKSFRPGRELTIGGVLDNSNVEYEAMRMQLVSAPLQFRYRIEPKGRLKTYALAGFGLNVIAQSDIDVMVEYNFPSLTEGENPNNVPTFARTIRQAQRVSEDIRKKAPFSTLSFISANIGVGIEYMLDEHKTLFLQSAYQYQIPNLRFSNHDGKHLLTLSLQAGVRTPLGN